MVLDIVNLIENNPVSKLGNAYQSKLLTKIQESFTDDQQHLFIASFYCYLNSNPKEFVIDLDNIWEWLGFSKKGNAKKTLAQHFSKDIDYKIIVLQVENNDHCGRINEKITMTVKTFKKLCMKASTKKADEIHDYFIRLEEILQETIAEESTELQKQLEASDTLLKSTEAALQSQHEKFKKLVRKKHYDTEPGQMVYVYKNDVTDANSIIRVGKTDNIKIRETHYNAANINGEIVYAKRCYNNDIMEKVCHHILDKYRVHREQEWFQIPDHIGVQVVNIAHLLMDELIPYVELLDTHDIFQKLSVVLNALREPEIQREPNPFENIYEKINTEIEEKKKRPIETQDFTVNKTLDFDSFIRDRCDIGDDLVCLKVDIYGAHKLWSRNQERNTKHSLFEHFTKNFRSGKKFYEEHNATLAVFYGLRPKEFVFSPADPENVLEIEQFVMERCKVGYTYRTSHKTLYEEFENWKQVGLGDYELDRDTKTKIRDYFNTKFFPTMVYLNSSATSSELSNNAHGVWGVTMKNDSTNVGIKLAHSLKKKLVQIDADTNTIVNTWDSLTSASKSLGLSPSSLSTDIRFKRLRDNCVLQYVEWQHQ